MENTHKKNFLFCILLLLFLFNYLQAQRDIYFTDITDTAGVGDETHSPSCAMADFNNDSLLDIYLCIKNIPNKLYENIDGTNFQNIAPSANVDDPSTSMDCSFADINNDGWIDLFVSNEFDSSRVYLNNGNGTYTDITASSGIYTYGLSHSPSFSDIDGDGDLDLYITNAEGYCWMFINNGDNSFTDSSYWCGTQGMGETFSCFFGDINNDLVDDLYIVSRGSLRNVMYMGMGNGQFIDTTSWSGTQCGNSAGQSSLLFDYDNDGDLDLYVVNGTFDPDSLYENTGNGQFINITPHALISDSSYGRSASCGDFNNDGFQDIIVLNAWGKISVYQNNGNGTFTDVASTSGLVYQEDPAGGAVGDIDNDGDLDLYITNITGKNRLYRNMCDDQNYLKVKLVGTLSNRFGIGSKIEILNQNDSLISFREMHIGKSRLAMNPPVAHFGIPYGQIYSVRVTFPSGIIVDSSNITAEQTITIYETETAINESINNQQLRARLKCLNSNLKPPFAFTLFLPENQKIISTDIYNACGKLIKSLKFREKNKSKISIIWNGLLENSRIASNGIYFLKTTIVNPEGENYSLNRKLVIIK
jgi:hypothetical protein